MKALTQKVAIAVVVALAISSTKAGVIDEVARGAVEPLVTALATALQATLIEKWSKPLPNAQKSKLNILFEALGNQSYENLIYIKTNVSGTDICSQLIDCEGFPADQVAKYADAQLTIRDKKQNATSAIISTIIAISGVVISILSLVFSLRSKKVVT